MSAFRKAKTEQAALKVGIFGPSGAGKTFTSLLMAEGLAGLSGKRVAFVDTEHGTAFYCQAVPTRAVHKEAFDFDAIYTRSITEVLTAVRGISHEEYGVIVIDSISHIWAACIEAYAGRQTSAGTIPMHAWGRIKKPYNELMNLLLSSPMHVIICGRQATEWANDDESEELKAVGLKMKAEGSTPYEVHVLLRMEAIKPRKTTGVAQIVAYAEKDRTGVLAGRSFINPTFDTLCRPLLPLLGATQAQIAGADETAAIDAEQLAKEEAEREKASSETLRTLGARIALAQTHADLKMIGKEITPQLKAKMLSAHVTDLREKYLKREWELA